jgi:hypothetical protein
VIKVSFSKYLRCAVANHVSKGALAGHALASKHHQRAALWVNPAWCRGGERGITRKKKKKKSFNQSIGQSTIE